MNAWTRRTFLKTGTAAVAAANVWARPLAADDQADLVAEAARNLEPYFTPPDEFRDVSRGKPLPHSLPEEKRRSVGLTRDSWSLEVVSDPEHEADIRSPLSREKGTALDFAALVDMGRSRAVKFAKVMTCLNIGCPLGMGVWEGVPLRDVFWLTRPRQNIRRVYYYGYHNDDPAQMFRSSLPIDRVLEDPGDLPPVILCYKLNGEWLTPERGGPVRIVVPEAYGFKSIKWLQKVVVTNLYHANDTYAGGNNDVDSQLKTFAATLSIPDAVAAGRPFAVTGYAQVGVGGLRHVQTWIQRDGDPPPEDGAYFEHAPWREATILPPPAEWGGELPGGAIPEGTAGFDPRTGRPLAWPLPLSKVHWASVEGPLAPGQYTFRCRTIDRGGHGQPLPRPFRKSGHAAIEQKSITVA